MNAVEPLTGDHALVAALLAAGRWVGLATTCADGRPLASQVAVSAHDGLLLVHLSRLAEHTRNLIARPDCAVTFSEPDDGRRDPQTLARVTVRAYARILASHEPGYLGARGAYLERFPGARPRFGFADFELFALRPEGGRLVGGFGRACSLAAAVLQGLLGGG